MQINEVVLLIKSNFGLFVMVMFYLYTNLPTQNFLTAYILQLEQIFSKNQVNYICKALRYGFM